MHQPAAHFRTTQNKGTQNNDGTTKTKNAVKRPR